jgi:hypothetical protein
LQQKKMLPISGLEIVSQHSRLQQKKMLPIGGLEIVSHRSQLHPERGLGTFPGSRSSNSFAALAEGEPAEEEENAVATQKCDIFGTNPHGMVGFGCNPVRTMDSEEHDRCLRDARTARAAARARETAAGDEGLGSWLPARRTRGLQAPRPRGKPRRAPLSAAEDLGLLLETGADLAAAPLGGLLATVGSDLRPGEKMIEVVVDSGAVASVAPPGLFPGAVEPSVMSLAGRTYRAANGSPIKNHGQVRVPFESSEGHKCSLPFQVADVEHALLSVGHLAATGNKVELHAKGGTITNVASGRAMALVRRGNVYVLRLRVSGFPRQGAGR